MASPKVRSPDAVVPQTSAVAVAEAGVADIHPASDVSPDQLDGIFKELKTLLNTVEKLQKAREDVGDIKPMLIRLLDGELISGNELDQLKSGVTGLAKLIKLYSDYQQALEKAQPARTWLDTVLKG